MNKSIAHELQKKAAYIAELYSGEREKNYYKEKFVVDKITPLSDAAAAVTYRKDTNKFALAFFYWVEVNGGQWYYFFPTDSHLLAMQAFSQAKQLIEYANYGFNFSEVE